MNKKANELLEAQLRFTLKSYKGKQLEKKIALNIDLIFDYLKDVTANELISKEQIEASVQSVLCEVPLNTEMLDVMYTLVLGVADLELLEKTAIKDLMSKKSYKLIVDQIAASGSLREESIARVMDSALYSELISEVLYNGIKDYLLDENFLVKMRGVSALVKAGRWGINMSMPKLDETVEETTKAYIQENIKRTVGLSKTFLEHAFDDKRVKSISNTLWKELKDKKLNTFTAALDEDLADELIGIGEQLWDDSRNSGFVFEIFSGGAGIWLEAYGHKPIIQLLETIGIGKDGITAQVQAYAPAVVKAAEQSGYLEASIRDHLKSFYSCKEVRDILER